MTDRESRKLDSHFFISTAEVRKTQRALLQMDPLHVILREEGLLNGMTRRRKPEGGATKKPQNGKGETAMNKTWNETAIEMIGTIKIDNEGKIESTCRQFDKTVKYTVTLKVADETPWGVLGGENTWVYVDGLGQDKMDSLNALKAAGKLDRTTRIVFKGHLVRTPGKPGMNDLYNLKFMKARPAAEDESITVNFEEALTKNEWQVICAERKAQANGTAVSMTAPTAPVAPSVPF